jgi:hypothetical protein
MARVDRRVTSFHPLSAQPHSMPHVLLPIPTLLPSLRKKAPRGKIKLNLKT